MHTYDVFKLILWLHGAMIFVCNLKERGEWNCFEKEQF